MKRWGILAMVAVVGILAVVAARVIVPALASARAPKAELASSLPPVPIAQSTPTPRPLPAAGKAAALSAGSPLEPAKEVYSQNCARCHGEGGNGITNIDLSSGDFLRKRGEANLVKSIAQGRGVMPAFGQSGEAKLSGDDVKAVYQYVLFLAGMTPSSAPGKAGAVPTAVPKDRGPVPPNEIPHGVKGWEDKCLACHGRQGFKPVQVSHAGRTNSMCLNCHWVKAGVPEVAVTNPPPATPGGGAPTVPHAVPARGPGCDQCHSASGYKPLPASHERFNNAPCAMCHKSVVSKADPTPVASQR